jgi:hypothetical protein
MVERRRALGRAQRLVSGQRIRDRLLLDPGMFVRRFLAMRGPLILQPAT